MSKLRDSRGQTIVLTVVFLTGLLGMTAFVLDIGSWYQAHRAAQATADAAALAAAQALPHDPGQAKALALDYAARNGGGVTAANVTFSTKYSASDTVKVRVNRSAPGLFATIFKMKSVAIGTEAIARAATPAAAQWVAPIVVHYKHPLLWDKGKTDPKFGVETELKLRDLHSPGAGDAAGAFGLIDLLGGTGTVGASTLAEWMRTGFDGTLPVNAKYGSVPSAMFNSGPFTDALKDRIGEEILLPVYQVITGPGGTAQYHVIGFVGFKVTFFSGEGDTGTVKGSFTRYIAQGIQTTSSSSSSAFGTRIISLVG